MSGAALHASWGWFGAYAYFGVVVFFAISGFLLYRPFALAHSGGRRAPRIGAYTRRRLLRILPAYWVALTVLSLWPGVEGAFTNRWWVYYGSAQVYSVNTLTNGLAVAWSLCVEMSFYLFLPFFAAFVAWLVARGVNPLRWWQVEALVLAVFACVSVIAQVYIHDHTAPYWVANTLAGTSEWFVAGMALAVLSVAAHDGPGRARRLSGVVERWSWLVWLAAVWAFLAATRVFDVRDLTSGRPGVYGVSTATWLANHTGLGVAAGLLLAPAVLGARGPIRWLLSEATGVAWADLLRRLSVAFSAGRLARSKGRLPKAPRRRPGAGAARPHPTDARTFLRDVGSFDGGRGGQLLHPRATVPASEGPPRQSHLRAGLHRAASRTSRRRRAHLGDAQ